MGRKRVFLVGVVSSRSRRAQRARAELGSADHLPRAPGPRRRAHRARRPVDHHDDVRGGSGADEGDGVWAAIAVGGGAVGLVLGGVLTTALSWPWIFFVNVPVGIAVFIASMRFVPESKDEHAHKSFDVAGAVTVTAGLLALVYGMSRRRRRAGRRCTPAASSRSPRAARRVRRDRAALRRAARPPEHLPRANRACRERRDVPRRRRALRDVLLQHALSPARARLLRARGRARLPPVHAGIIIGAGLSQSLVPRLGAREVPLIGMPMAVVGLLLFMRLQPDGSYVTDLLPGIMLASIGMGLTFVPITLIATSGIPADDAGSRPASTTPRSRSAARSGSRSSRRSRSSAQETLSGLGARAATGGRGTGARGRLPRRVPRERGARRRRLLAFALPPEPS